MNDLFDEVAFGVYLMALGRNAQAQEIFAPITTVQFRGNYNIWTPVGYAICIQARLLRLENEEQSWHTLIERIREHPVEAFAADDLAERLHELSRELDDGYRENSLKWASHRMAMVLSVLCYYRECALANIPHATVYNAELVESLIITGFMRLGERLDSL